MTPAVLTLTCPACKAERLHPLSLLDGHLVGPIVTLRIRSTGGERSQRALSVTCEKCGLVSLYDADWVQAKVHSAAPSPS